MIGNQFLFFRLLLAYFCVCCGADSASDLGCSASDTSCCWFNEERDDTLDWKIGNGVKPSVLDNAEKKNFTLPPFMKSNSYFFAGHSTRLESGPEQAAWLRSCPIKCLDSGAQISISEIRSFGDVKLRACVVKKNTSGPASDCSPFKITSFFGSATLNLSSGFLRDAQLIIEAEGFTKSSLVAMEEIFVKYTTDECIQDIGNQPKPQSDSRGWESRPEEENTEKKPVSPDPPPMPSPPPEKEEIELPDTEEEIWTEQPEEVTEMPEYLYDYDDYSFQAIEDEINAVSDFISCETIQCFDKKCKFFDEPTKLSVTDEADIPWGLQSPDSNNSVIGNAVTGIDSEGKSYYGTYLRPNQSSIQPVTGLELEDDRVLSFELMERTFGIQLSLCPRSIPIECYWSSDESFLVESWRKQNIRLPSRTEKIYFVAENLEGNQGGVGIRNLQLSEPYDPDDLSVSDPGAAVCQTKQKRLQARKQLARLKMQRKHRLRNAIARNQKKISRLGQLRKI